MQRRAAIAAYFLRCGFDAQPVTARGTFGIQALNGPTGQVLHPDSPRENENEPTTTSRKFGVLGTTSRQRGLLQPQKGDREKATAP